MWLLSLRDLQWRRRRFLIAVFAAALVFSLTLLLSGAGAGVRSEPARIVAAFGADRWFVAPGTSGPFTASSAIPAAAAEEVAQLEGVERADPFLYLRYSIGGDAPLDVNVIGYREGGIGTPPVDEGRLPSRGELLADTRIGLAVGEHVEVGGQMFEIVGRAAGISFNFGVPTVYMLIEDVQALAFGGEPLATGVVARGTPAQPPAGLVMLTNEDVVADARRPMTSGLQTVDFINVLLWIVAAGIIGSITYLSALERTRDFAVMKATGASGWPLLVGLALQAVVLSVAAAAVAVVLAQFLRFGFPFEIRTPLSAYISLPLVAIVIGLIASIAGLRRALRVDPAVAFRGA